MNPITHPVIMAVLALVFAGGGYYADYFVTKVTSDSAEPKLCHNFDQQVHTVERVVDGDTVVLEDKTIVRLMSIDAPDEKDCYYEESTKALSKLVLGKSIILEKGSDTEDAFGRLLRYVFIYNADSEKDNPFVNDLMIKKGAAIPLLISADRRYEPLIKNSYAIAQKEGEGMHGKCEQDPDLLTPPSKKCLIIGNYSRNTRKSLYYLPEGCLNYDRLTPRRSEGDQYFCTEAEAKKAGFQKSGTCK